ncbi:hypothetical protein E8P82_09340 [Arthrobacter echini]|uniref:ATP synthase protein I n=1 Tax=Arthrobacter echini TaxID=1529066 RepID=A0A4S5E423_9MICC|nr:hypothetical protein [Arthrobacter echini]THJ66198.1 hypothetical protein E8P82_09340 [Arthrobacter echini]
MTGADRHPLIEVSAPTASPWLRILGRSTLAGSVTALVLATAALIATSPEAASSVLLGAVLVIVFFGISLLIGHVAGASNPSGALGLFVLTYAIKVVGFGAALFILGTPAWLDPTWFFVSALVTVIVWQIAEIRTFSRIRTLRYDDEAPALTPLTAPKDPSREGR